MSNYETSGELRKKIAAAEKAFFLDHKGEDLGLHYGKMLRLLPLGTKIDSFSTGKSYVVELDSEYKLMSIGNLIYHMDDDGSTSYRNVIELYDQDNEARHNFDVDRQKQYVAKHGNVMKFGKWSFDSSGDFGEAFRSCKYKGEKAIALIFVDAGGYDESINCMIVSEEEYNSRKSDDWEDIMWEKSLEAPPMTRKQEELNDMYQEQDFDGIWKKMGGPNVF